MNSAVGGGTIHSKIIKKYINRQRFKIEETLDRRTTKFLFIVYKKRSQDCYKKKHI
jgi:hypothetical protein